jgi:hypothetical protein
MDMSICTTVIHRKTRWMIAGLFHTSQAAHSTKKWVGHTCRLIYPEDPSGSVIVVLLKII